MTRRNRKLIVAKLTCLAGVAAIGLIGILDLSPANNRVQAFSSGPPPSHTAAPGELDCSTCHIGGDQAKFEEALQGGNGITISGVPAEYTPGASYVVSLTVAHAQSPNNTLYGFQLTAVDGTGVTPGAFSLTHLPGQLQIIDGITPFQNRKYVEHTVVGTTPVVNGSKTWQFTWTAPPTDVGPITLYAAGNAADNSGTETGDRIYTNSFLTNPGAIQPSTTRFDLDGDSKTDIGIFRPGPGEWWYLRSIDGVANAFQFGQGTDVIAPADFTGDGATDVAFFRDGQWFVLRSEDSSFFAFPFGTAGDIPVPGDYDGDGMADPAVFRPAIATWFYIQSSDQQVVTIQFGLTGDQPIVEDYDGDGKDDLAVFRPSASEWFLQRSTDGFIGFQFGVPGNTTPAPADFTGDGRTDIAFYQPTPGAGGINWFVLRSEDSSFFAFPFGTTGDIPVPGDYDGDGTADPAVFRPTNNTWFLQQSTSGFTAVGFGITNDIPIPSAYIP